MRVLAIGCAVLVLAGCASGEEDGLGGSDLEGRRFVATEVTGFETVGGTTISIRFDGDTIGLDAGCNSIGGSYAIEEGRLVVDDLFITEIGCDPERHAQDEFLASFVTSGATVELASGVLTLSDGTVTVEMTDRTVADPDRRVVGTFWVLDSIIDRDAVSSVPGDVRASVEFPDEGSLSLFDGCNDGSASVEVGDGEMRVGPVRLTAQGCPDESSQLTSEALQEVFASSVVLEFEVDADLLTITNGDRGLVFRAAE